jgi:arsenate reductase
MAEAWINHLASDTLEAVSAGANPTGFVHPVAIDVMREVGIDIQHATSKLCTEFLKQEFDFVITVCDDAAETCPVFPGLGARMHWPFKDPAKFSGSIEEVKEAFRRTRDRVRMRIEEFLSEESRLIFPDT